MPSSAIIDFFLGGWGPFVSPPPQPVVSPADPPVDTVLRMEGKPSMWQGWDSDLLDREGLMNEVSPGGDLNFPWLIATSAMMGNAMTTAMFFDPHWYDTEYGFDASGPNSNWQGAAGQPAIGGSTIWW